MAKKKVPFELIEGYAEMSAEDKIKALEALEFDTPDDLSAELKTAKEQRDMYASKIAENERKARAEMDEESRRKAETDEKYADLESKYNALIRESTISKSVAKYISLGYTEALAIEKAEAMADGDTDRVFKAEEKYKNDIEKDLKASLTKGTPPPDEKGAAKAYKTRDEIMNIKDTMERRQAIAENPELFGIQQ